MLSYIFYFIIIKDEHTIRWTGSDRKKIGTGPELDQIFILVGWFSVFVFTNNLISGLDQTVYGKWDLTRTGPKTFSP